MKNNTGNWNTGYRNTGDCNTGYRNTGDRNTGDWNTGNCNTGNWNTGCRNTGDCNIGNCNTGDCNTGDRNTGDWNTGNCNTGNWNTGDWNTCNNSNGVFCTIEPTINLFNKPTNMTLTQFRQTKAYDILCKYLCLSKWIGKDNMTEDEKKLHPEYETIGGYLKKYTYKEMWENAWEKMSDKEKQEIMNLPNFDKDIFYEITGIKID